MSITFANWITEDNCSERLIETLGEVIDEISLIRFSNIWFQIEFSNMATQSKQIVKDNNLEHIIDVIHGKVEDVKELPDGIEKVPFI